MEPLYPQRPCQYQPVTFLPKPFPHSLPHFLKVPGHLRPAGVVAGPLAGHECHWQATWQTPRKGASLPQGMHSAGRPHCQVQSYAADCTAPRLLLGPALVSPGPTTAGPPILCSPRACPWHWKLLPVPDPLLGEEWAGTCGSCRGLILCSQHGGRALKEWGHFLWHAGFRVESCDCHPSFPLGFVSGPFAGLSLFGPLLAGERRRGSHFPPAPATTSVCGVPSSWPGPLHTWWSSNHPLTVDICTLSGVGTGKKAKTFKWTLS
ncbi:LOW QUALITY PROTEIN: uncharacterized protein LOC117098814 [Trachypithecus francoisi]|uniref:LOW QUALITY PROTEIN: uncharacterized protein LOC117098814 n=1 Tax=Trachypithecus francoisi TaxID=54180 RepID=UPI00141ACB83|nr:LOW QUALITY PROTEIN: uncharacterized protein LOC117098814 [Trachypithecus francoisi]